MGAAAIRTSRNGIPISAVQALGYAELRSELLFGKTIARGDLFARRCYLLTVTVLAEPEQSLLQRVPLVRPDEHRGG